MAVSHVAICGFLLTDATANADAADADPAATVLWYR